MTFKLKFCASALLLLFLALASVPTMVFADRDSNRPSDRIAVDLGVTEEVFLTCFDPVEPAGNKAPSGARQHMNKARLLPCLQAANPQISNAMLDHVMDKYRPEGPMRK